MSRNESMINRWKLNTGVNTSILDVIDTIVSNQPNSFVPHKNKKHYVNLTSALKGLSRLSNTTQPITYSESKNIPP